MGQGARSLPPEHSAAVTLLRTVLFDPPPPPFLTSRTARGRKIPPHHLPHPPTPTQDESEPAEIGPFHRERGRHVAGAAVRGPGPLGSAARPGTSADDPEDQVEDVEQQQQERVYFFIPDM